MPIFPAGKEFAPSTPVQAVVVAWFPFTGSINIKPDVVTVIVHETVCIAPSESVTLRVTE